MANWCKSEEAAFVRATRKWDEPLGRSLARDKYGGERRESWVRAAAEQHDGALRGSGAGERPTTAQCAVVCSSFLAMY